MKTQKKLTMILISVFTTLILISCEKFSYDLPIVDAPSHLNEEVDVSLIIPVSVPEIRDIPDQTIFQGQTFRCIPLDKYVSDPDNSDCDLCWECLGNSELILTIDHCRTVTIEVPGKDWTGSETVRFTVRDPDRNFASDLATFTVKQRENNDLKKDDVVKNDDIREEVEFNIYE